MLWPLLLYGGLALLFWGPWVLDDPSTKLLAANDRDPSAYLWFFSWWPHALADGLDLFHSAAIFVPEGYNLAWVTSMPGPSMLLAPVTLTLGAEVTFNLLSFAAPALAAWTAFLLCRHVTGIVPASLLGGFLFGFSPYMLNQLRGAPQLALIALVPLMALLVLRHAEGSLSDRRFALALTAVFTAQILTSTEILATSVLFGAVVLVAAYAIFRELRERLRRTGLLAGAALAATAVIASPLLYNVFFRERTLPEQALAVFPTDLLAFLVPGPLVALAPGRLGIGEPAYATGAAYIGIPLLLLLGVSVWRGRADRGVLLAAVAFAITAIASLGPTLHVRGGDTGVPLPWAVFDGLPLLRYAIPLRFPAFAFLAAGVMLAMWLARGGPRLRWGGALVAIALLLPAVGHRDWRTELDDVPFFADGGYRGQLDASDRVLTVPTWGRNMRWQVQTDFSFDLAAGYVGAFPESYERYRAWRDLLGSPFGREAIPPAGELRRFLEAKGVTAIVVEQGRAGRGRELFRSLGVTPEEAGGVLLYRLSPARR